MDCGFIGAGKVGFSLGRHFKEHGIPVSGYISKSPQSAADAAAFTESKNLHTMKQLVEVSDALFLTVPDGAIASVWETLRSHSISGKLIFHVSGALTSDVFTGIEETGATGYSLHPLLAVSDRNTSYKDLESAFFTLEGPRERMDDVLELLKPMGNKISVVDGENKPLYHAASAVASNFVVPVLAMAMDLLSRCGFDEDITGEALGALVRGNVENVLSKGPVQALTGPIERGDSKTVESHLLAMPDDYREFYVNLARETLKIAQKKHPDRDYSLTEDILK